jgi:hypothetical protein
MCSIGGRLRSRGASPGGANNEIPLLVDLASNPGSSLGTVAGWQFDWGGRLPKCNGGAQRFPQGGWKSPSECIGIRELDCETYKSSRNESWSK